MNTRFSGAGIANTTKFNPTNISEKLIAAPTKKLPTLLAKNADAARPTAKNVIPTKNAPKYWATINPTSGVENITTVKGKVIVENNNTPKNPTKPTNFAPAICHSDTGCAKSNSIVSRRNSSENDLIARAGPITTKNHGNSCTNGRKFASPNTNAVLKYINIEISKKGTITTYAIDELMYDRNSFLTNALNPTCFIP
jgi:hypothetical protein